jgi:hypothetical protein
VFALIEASGHICPHSFLKSTQSEFLFEEELQLGLAGGIAATTRMSSFALIAADEEMLFELGHRFNLQDSGASGAMRRAAREEERASGDSNSLGGCALTKFVDSEFQ